MLNKIILLNSGKYQKAVITLDCDAIQICGGNNAGKTSLISVLNFLYLPSSKDWKFDKPSAETLKYYFPKLDKSYIIFEIFAGSYFCILIKRNDNNELDYYKIQSPYDELQDSFFKQTKNGKALLDFESISSNTIGKIEPLNKQKFKELLYGQSKKDKTVLWLKKDTTQKSFNDIYRYLLNTKLINNKVVKESLLVADGKSNISREFTDKEDNEIKRVKQHKQEIDILESIKPNFSHFTDIVDEYNSQKNELEIDYQSFYNLHNHEVQKNKDNLRKVDDVIAALEKETTGINSKKNESNTKVYESELQRKNTERNNKNQTIIKIEQYTESLLRAEREESQERLEKSNYALSQIKNESYNIEKINILISEQKEKIKELTNNIENFSDLLIHNIAKDTETKETVKILLKDEVLNLDKSKILHPISKANHKTIDIFDGKIDISDIKKEKLTTVNELEKQLSDREKQLKKYKVIEDNINNQQNTESEIKGLNKRIAELNEQIKDIENLPTFKEELTALKSEEEKLKADIEKSKKDDDCLEKELAAIQQRNADTSKQKDECTKIDKDLAVYNTEFQDDTKYLQVTSNEKCDLLIDKLVEKIRNSKNNIVSIRGKKDVQFRDLKEKLKNEHADEIEFIKEIKGEMAAINDKKTSVKELLDSITHNISDPTRKFLTSLDEFKAYITNLNTKFKKYKISNLNEIEIKIKYNADLVQDLKHIANINVNNLFADGEDNNNKIEILLKYIEDGKTFYLHHLFDFQFMVNGKSADLAQQTESNGTDRMLKIILFILIMKELVIQDKDNKLIIYIDELGEVDDSNISQLIDICKESNFLPIFASPDKKPHIDKYYDLLETSGNDKLIVDDNRAIYANKN